MWSKAGWKHTDRLCDSGRIGRKKGFSCLLEVIGGERRTLIKGNAPITSFLNFIPPGLPLKLILLFIRLHISEQCLLQSRLDRVPGAPSPLLQRSHGTGLCSVPDLWPLVFRCHSHTHEATSKLSLFLSLLVICKQVHLYSQHAHVRTQVCFDSDFWNGRLAATDAGSW